MSIQLFSNNASTTLAGNITSGSLSLSVLTGSGALFPVIAGGSGNWFVGTLIKAGAPATLEIVKVTATATDTFTITRGWENTTPLSWNAGDTFALLNTAGTFGNLVQAAQLQVQGGGYAIDTGAANAYVVGLTPTLTTPVVGMPIRWLASHGNVAGTCTFNPGPGAASMVAQGGVLVPGMIITGNLYTCVWDGARYQLLNPTIYASRGQFPGVLNGVSGAGALTMNWSRVFDMVTLFNSTGWVSSSTSTVLTLTAGGGFPSDIIPVTSKIVSASGSAFEDNSVPGVGSVDAEIFNTGFIEFFKNGGFLWTVGGSKGISGTMCITYSVQ
jgi:hypothetical protein